MSGGSSGGESDAVLAFIREQQEAVLQRAIDELRSCPPADLRGVAHAVHGTLGSYQLDAAHEQIVTLSAVLADPSTTVEAAEEARARTVATLVSLQPALHGNVAS